TFDNKIFTAYSVRAKKTLDLSSETLDELHTGMIDVVNGPGGTAHQASLDNVETAGKTGTAQWGPKNKERTAAWFTGFLPADQPRFAFAALYEGEVGSKVHGGSAAAPMIADIFKEIYKGQQANGTRKPRAAKKPKCAGPSRWKKMSRIRFCCLPDLTRGHANITSKAITTFRHRRKDLGARKTFVAKCEVCENEYDKAFELTVAGKRHTYDSVECAIHALAP